MKFFWKMFFATMFVCVICFSLGGYILINFNFNSLLESEVKTAYSFGDIVYYSLANELKDNENFYMNNDTNDMINEVAESININTTNGKIRFSIVNNEKESFYSSLEKNLDKRLLKDLSISQKGYTLKQTESEIYIQAFRPAKFFGQNYYIETIQDVTYIFDNQKSQYNMIMWIIVGIFVLGGTLTFIISKLLIRQVVSLTKVTKEISAGNLSKRVKIKGQDEFSLLSKNFNYMADDLEEKIYELKREAERRERFVSDFSHELKTPLTSIIGYSDILRRKELNPERISLCANYIFTEGKRLETLSMRLLDLIVLKNQEIHIVPVLIREFLEEINFIISPQLKEENIEMLINLQPAIVKLEPELMKTVFINIIDNARKAIDGKGYIHITGIPDKDTYRIIIEDNGKGMEKHELSKIKEAFYMVDKSRAREQGGAGLGLSICDQILRLHDFEIEFYSTVGEGTKVTVIMKGVQSE